MHAKDMGFNCVRNKTEVHLKITHVFSEFRKWQSRSSCFQTHYAAIYI